MIVSRLVLPLAAACLTVSTAAWADCTSQTSGPTPLMDPACMFSLNLQDNVAFVGTAVRNCYQDSNENLGCTVLGASICWHDGQGPTSDPTHWHFDVLPACATHLFVPAKTVGLRGDDGDDTLVVQEGPAIVQCPDPTRGTFTGFNGDTVIAGGTGSDALYSGYRDDFLVAFEHTSAGDECLPGYDAVDTLCGGSGYDTLVGETDAEVDCLVGNGVSDECFPSLDTDVVPPGLCDVAPTYTPVPPPGAGGTTALEQACVDACSTRPSVSDYVTP